MKIERTAPRTVDDCPLPASEYMSWQSGRSFLAQEFTGPREAIEHAQRLQSDSEYMLRAAMFGLIAEGLSVAEVARLTGIPVKTVRKYRDSERWARARRDYSAAYYVRHPDRVPGEWYPVEEGDPELPEGPIGVRTREADEA